MITSDIYKQRGLSRQQGEYLVIYTEKDHVKFKQTSIECDRILS